jgi:hypothetical protein
MSRELISLSPDLKRLRDEGYAVDIRGGMLVVEDVPYVDSGRRVRRGALVSSLSLGGEVTTRPDTHVVYFAGDYPCDREGHPLEAIRHESVIKDHGSGVVTQHSFSSKPADGYPDYYAKMTSYVAIVAHHARALDPIATALTFPVVVDERPDSPFVHLDTASSRAGIGALADRLALGCIGIVGLGGTGSYVLDLIAKTPVREIRLYDGDVLLQHNAFRSPGAPSVERLRDRPSKVAHLAEIYSAMHKNIVPIESFLEETNAQLLDGTEFVFVCVDGSDAKRAIIARLEANGTPFIDVGIGVDLHGDVLGGHVRCTFGSTAGAASPTAEAAGPAPGVYDSNIQIADLNCLNAALAVIRWKRAMAFYSDLERERESVYTIDGNTITNDQGQP